MTSPSLMLFCLRSLRREYGISFLRHVILRHPVQTLQGLRRYVLDKSAIEVSELEPGARPALSIPGVPPKILVGLGFCLKPVNPECPSGRANHFCDYLERSWHLCEHAPPTACRDCRIRDIGLQALNRGCALYIMTSARDILFDIMLPAMQEKRFEYAMLALCRYSFEPFRIAVSIAGLKARLFAFESGDCEDYNTWLLADRGTKHEQTCFNSEDYSEIIEFLGHYSVCGEVNIQREGNVFFPRAGRRFNPRSRNT